MRMDAFNKSTYSHTQKNPSGSSVCKEFSMAYDLRNSTENPHFWCISLQQVAQNSDQ